MSSARFRRIAREYIRKNKALFDTLMEFEKTKKIRTKTRLNFTIDKSTATRFRKYCHSYGYNMSAKIEKAMEEMIK